MSMNSANVNANGCVPRATTSAENHISVVAMVNCSGAAANGNGGVVGPDDACNRSALTASTTVEEEMGRLLGKLAEEDDTTMVEEGEKEKEEEEEVFVANNRAHGANGRRVWSQDKEGLI